MEVALKKQSEIQQIIVNAIASERDAVQQLASDFQFDGNVLRTFLGRLPKVDLIILEGEKMSVRPYVRPSVHKKFLRFQ